LGVKKNYNEKPKKLQCHVREIREISNSHFDQIRGFFKGVGAGLRACPLKISFS
jgi:hypothetical protein